MVSTSHNKTSLMEVLQSLHLKIVTKCCHTSSFNRTLLSGNNL